VIELLELTAALAILAGAILIAYVLVDAVVVPPPGTYRRTQDDRRPPLSPLRLVSTRERRVGDRPTE